MGFDLAKQLQKTNMTQQVRIIACGAIANEILAIKEQEGLHQISLQCLPAILHNSPQKIPQEVSKAILAAKAEGISNIFVGYADCGTGGMLDKICQKYNVQRLQGPHCYSFFVGNKAFCERTVNEITSFYLTDFLARQFDAFVTKPLGLDKYPELTLTYFGHYEKLVYLAQSDDPVLDLKAQKAAQSLGLLYERHFTGYGDLTNELKELNIK